MARKIDVTAILSDTSPFDLTESYVRLRTNFIYTTLNGTYKKIVFTSCESGEGKTTLVLNLAIMLAKIGKKVLVLDCDMRKSLMRHYLHNKNSAETSTDETHHRKGLSSILSNLEQVEDCIHHDPRGFDVIYAGSHVPNPSELLSSPQMQQLLDTAEQNYDFVLLDAPPVLSVSDPAILSTVCDGVIFIVQHERIKKKQLGFALQAMKAVGSRMLGTVMVQYNAKKDHSLYGYNGKYYYHYYYGK